MKKKEYEKPSVEVVVMKQTGMLMTSNQSSVQNYNWNNQDPE